MNQDINIKKVRLNCYRQSKVPGEFMLQMRVPGGTVDAKYLSYVEHIAKTLTVPASPTKISRRSTPIWSHTSKK